MITQLCGAFVGLTIVMLATAAHAQTAPAKVNSLGEVSALVKPLVETYIASLPATHAHETWRDPAIESRLGSESRTGPWPASSRVARAPLFASCSPPATTLRGYVGAPASRKPRVVAVMNRDSALELLALEDRPAAAGDPIAFVRSLEGEFDRR